MERLFEKVPDNNNVSILRSQDPPFPSLLLALPPFLSLPFLSFSCPMFAKCYTTQSYP